MNHNIANAKVVVGLTNEVSDGPVKKRTLSIDL